MKEQIIITERDKGLFVERYNEILAIHKGKYVETTRNLIDLYKLIIDLLEGKRRKYETMGKNNEKTCR